VKDVPRHTHKLIDGVVAADCRGLHYDSHWADSEQKLLNSDHGWGVLRQGAKLGGERRHSGQERSKVLPARSLSLPP
jgi:hypothetical protein